MPQLSAAATLDLWQEAEGRDPVARSLALAAASGGSADEVAALPVGRRDALLLELHAGAALEATAACPACGEQAEFSVDTQALLARNAEAIDPAPVASVSWRSPDSRDVAAAASAGDAQAAERILLERCVGAGELEPEARAAVARAMAEADPLAELLVELFCPACGEEFVADLDVAAFVWAGLRARARRLLFEVDVLARAYGWSEADVLALDERRRTAYLELAEAGA
ncbi:MAG TPA: hypothetical protein VGQ15_10790 [Gaiellaceae bacterium]|nr:hypothetical protein [Gaiellaceae bacterium]